MTFTPLETMAITACGSFVTGIGIKMWADNTYMRKVDCQTHTREMRVLMAFMRLVLEKLGIPTEKQLEIERGIYEKPDVGV